MTYKEELIEQGFVELHTLEKGDLFCDVAGAKLRYVGPTTTQYKFVRARAMGAYTVSIYSCDALVKPLQETDEEQD
ncbi:MAG: hypothetical protein KAJ03_00685 [Gammaproteobacteria bacterium]|nr:hypothetical protein [Gammaproteobacteria bacterium]